MNAANTSTSTGSDETKAKKQLENRSSIDFDTLRIQLAREDGTRVTKTLSAITLADLKTAIAQAAEATVTKTKVTLRAPLSGLAAIARELTDFKVPTG